MGSMLLHRFRAERLLQEEFESLRAGVTTTVAARLRLAGVHLDADDVDACYAAAWQGLYAAMLDGQEIENATGWLTLVTHRRAIDEHRARRRIECTPIDDRDDAVGPGSPAPSRAFVAAALTAAQQRDLATDLDDRIRIGQLLEALRARLDSREREAATLCYLHGLSRAEAAAQMGISESRMRKLMEGGGSARPGVCAKLGALVETIAAGRWCEEQGSLMRGFAYGILDPGGERYRLARTHHTACPSCRAYVLSLRGLAAVLPPVPAMLHLALGAGAAAGAGAGAGSGAASGAGAGATVPAGSGAGGAALSASGAGGAVGAGAAGGGWWLAGGPLGAKLAVGCLLALGVGAGCVALEGRPQNGRAATHGQHARASAKRRGGSASEGAVRQRVALSAVTPAAAAAAQAPPQGARQLTAVTNSARAAREFGPEQVGRSGAASVQAAAQAPAAVARAASAASGGGVSSAAAAPTSASSRGSSGASTGASAPAAAREFAPG